jgi:hypothetical protein
MRYDFNVLERRAQELIDSRLGHWRTRRMRPSLRSGLQSKNASALGCLNCCLTLHRTRHLFIRQQTAMTNAIRAHLADS